MSDSYPFLSVDGPCEEVVTWAMQQVSAAGLSIIRTFDLKVARSAHSDCPCPYHGTEQCDCQMVVLLIYGKSNQPISLVVHGYEGKTWFSVVVSPEQHADLHLEATFRQALAPRNLPHFELENFAHAA